MTVTYFKRLLVALAIAALAPVAHAQFQNNMTIVQIEAQVQTQLSQGRTLRQVAEAALAAGLNAGVVTTAMINTTNNGAGVIGAMIQAGASPREVIQAAIAAGVDPSVAQTAAINVGVLNTVAQEAVTAAGLTLVTFTRPSGVQTTVPSGGGGNASRN